jgi:selenocysteine lyase/cysteine desulfurase
MAAQRHGISLGFIALTDDYQLDSDDFAAKYDEHVKLVAL